MIDSEGVLIDRDWSFDWSGSKPWLIRICSRYWSGSGVLIGIEAIIDSDCGHEWFGLGVLFNRDWNFDWSGFRPWLIRICSHDWSGSGVLIDRDWSNDLFGLLVSVDKDLSLNWFGYVILKIGIAVMIESGFKSWLIRNEAMIDRDWSHYWF
jgi:hypothetical protein